MGLQEHYSVHKYAAALPVSHLSRADIMQVRHRRTASFLQYDMPPACGGGMEKTMTASTPANSKPDNLRHTSAAYDVVYAALFAVLIAICSWISIPATVPFTLQTMGVFLAVSILGGRRGTLSVLVYILLGAVGLPVFAGFTGGIGILLGSTGGYIIGFLFSALAMWGIEHFFGCGRITLAISMLIGLAICYAFGTVWFMVVYTRGNGPVSLAAVLGWCVIPFLLPDLIKIAIALLIGPKIRKLAMIH